MKQALLFPVVLVGLLSCTGTTGSGHFAFQAFAAGVSRPASGPYTFDTPNGWRVVLTRASLRVGPVYLNHAVPISQNGAHYGYSSGRYIAEVLGQQVVDCLSPLPAPFPASGDGIEDSAETGEVWLYPDGTSDETPILDVAATATRGEETIAFSGRLALDAAWLAPADPSAPGASPLFSIRQVSSIPVAFSTVEGGSLLLRIDPARWFDSVADFTSLKANAKNGDGSYSLGGSGLASDATTVGIFNGIHAQEGVYAFQWSLP